MFARSLQLEGYNLLSLSLDLESLFLNLYSALGKNLKSKYEQIAIIFMKEGRTTKLCPISEIHNRNKNSSHRICHRV